MKRLPPSRLRTIALLVGGIPLLGLLLLVAAWAIDSSTGGSQVMRNVSVAGRDVGGLNADDLASVLGDVSADVESTPVELVLPEIRIPSNAADLGLQLDRQRTADAALEVGRDDPLLVRPFTWLGSFFGRRDAPLQFSVNGNQVASTVSELEEQVRQAAAEPGIEYRDGHLAVVPGKPGQGLDPAQVTGELSRVNELSGGVLSITVKPKKLLPRISDEEAQRLTDDLMTATASPPQAVVEGVARQPDSDRLRQLLRAVPRGDDLRADLDEAGTMALLGEMFEDVGTDPVDADVRVVDGQVVIDPGENGTGCCDASAVSAYSAALCGGVAGTCVTEPTVELALTPRAPERDSEHYTQLGLVEKVAEFTTRHPGGAPRVANIHRIADLVRGVVIEPGETFSVNDHVGPRTIASGFVAAPVIGENGYFEDDVGGGVSQFATTLFNAAFFAGLEIPAYQAHGIYINRYPYGREATLDYGNIDLQLRNNTPYGVLLWPTYTDTSITVDIYSTRYIEAGQSDQFEERYGAVCTRVTTVRKRTFLTTGEERFDRFYALYGPGEGIQCDGTTLARPGEPAPPPAPAAPPDSSTTTAAPPDTAATTTAPAPVETSPSAPSG